MPSRDSNAQDTADAAGAIRANGGAGGHAEGLELSEQLRERALEALKGSGNIPAAAAKDDAGLADEREAEGAGEYPCLPLSVPLYNLHLT